MYFLLGLSASEIEPKVVRGRKGFLLLGGGGPVTCLSQFGTLQTKRSQPGCLTHVAPEMCNCISMQPPAATLAGQIFTHNTCNSLVSIRPVEAAFEKILPSAEWKIPRTQKHCLRGGKS